MALSSVLIVFGCVFIAKVDALYPAPLPHLVGHVTHTSMRISSRGQMKSSVLNVSQIAAALDATFVETCMQSKSGNVDALKLFIVSTRAGYEQGMSIEDLSQALDACPLQSAGRPLADEEAELRILWAKLVYLTLMELGEPVVKAPLVNESAAREYGSFVTNLVQAKASGVALSKLNVEEMLGDVGTNVASRTPMQIAILRQSMRVVYFTITVLEEVKAAQQSGPQTRPKTLGDGVTPIPDEVFGKGD